ncbi:hypothetical protein CYFUS_004937 [Cystobacter fuscus]|uniref:Lipoprotein n=1 Tax=Cystobacter fuscus TaxID=43 RepID=A0A250J7A8_9BACT|nr:hypothetical protein [Cystobacter fuscus]ATB39493.1 hypothetical protein CYFUS_004937 [Cystobacter fuscus]
MRSSLLKGMLTGLALVLGGCGGLEVAEEQEPGFEDAAPAQAQHCVMEAVAFKPEEAPPSDLPPAKQDCFASFAEAIAFATNGAVQLPPTVTPDQLTPELLETDATPTQNVIAVEYQHSNYGGASLIFYNASTCAQSNMFVSSMPSGWNDIISSALAFAGCNNSYHYEHVNYLGSVVNCGTACPYIGDAMNDRTSSIYWTR